MLIAKGQFVLDLLADDSQSPSGETLYDILQETPPPFFATGHFSLQNRFEAPIFQPVPFEPQRLFLGTNYKTPLANNDWNLLNSSVLPCSPINCGNTSPWFVGGHLEAGLYVNQYGRRNSYIDGVLGPDSGNTTLLQNVRQSDFQLNQFYLNFGKKVESRHGFDIGGRIDFMYGTDAVFLQSASLERDAGHGIWRSGDYYTSLPQLYFEVGYKNLNIRMGKFLSPMGGESILSTDRFFYSLSDAYGELPDTMTGFVGQWNISDRLSISGGWVNGEDKTFDTSRDNAIVGDIFYKWNKHIQFGYATMFNVDTRTKDDWRYYIQSFVVGYKTGKWDYRFEWTLRNQKVGSNGRHFGSYGINQELIYRLNAHWSLGTRIEWMHRYKKSGDGYERYKITFGANWKPVKWLTIKPEIRYDHCDGNTPFNKPKDGSPGGRKNQVTGGVSTVIKF